MRRTAIGWMAGGMLLAAAALSLFGTDDQGLIGPLSRVGAILAVLWLAWPELVNVRNPLWIGVTLVTIGVVVFARSLLRYWLPAVAVLGILTYFRPRRAPRRPP